MKKLMLVMNIHPILGLKMETATPDLISFQYWNKTNDLTYRFRE